MAADSSSVKCGPTHGAEHLEDTSHAGHVQDFVQPGGTWSEFVAKVADLSMPGDGFAGDLEAIQAAQGLAEMLEWPD